MADRFVQLNIHIVFRVKSTFGRIREIDLPRLHSYIGGVVHGLGGVLLSIGGMPDHIHLLISMPATVSLLDFVREIKSKSSKWIKEIHPCYTAFAWQSGYGAFAVSTSIIEATRTYIENQRQHHTNKTYRDELVSFLYANKIDFDEKYLED